jgi:tetratricopeptide (TPR) repeat protein
LTDRVRTVGGSESGEVVSMTPTEVTVAKNGAEKENIAVNQIKSIIFDGEPTELTQARVNAANGGYVDALEKLNEIEVNKIDRDFIEQEVQFLKAYCAAQLVLSGTGEIAEAGRDLNTFVRAHPENYHYLAAVEAMGDLLMAAEKFDAAQKQYAELAKTPWPEYKLRAAVAVGRTLQAQGKHPEAIQEFDTVLSAAGDTSVIKNEQLAASLGKAISMAETGKLDEAVSMIEKLIQDADPEEKKLHARAYNALGSCYERANKTKDALLAYLHVDVLYNSEPEEHAEALAHLAPLWQAIGQEANAREARATLEQRYAGSRWAK